MLQLLICAKFLDVSAIFHLAFSWTPKQNDRSTNPPQIALTVSPWLLAVQIRETFSLSHSSVNSFIRLLIFLFN